MEIRYLPLYLQSRLENFAKVRNKRELIREELFLKQIRYRQLNLYKPNQSQTRYGFSNFQHSSTRKFCFASSEFTR